MVKRYVLCPRNSKRYVLCPRNSCPRNSPRNSPGIPGIPSPKSTVVTDQHGGYIGLSVEGFDHIRINHSVGEYVRDKAHTNGIESFWALLKRGHYGIYHYMSPKHLHRYVNEFAFRHNTAQAGTMRFIEMTAGRMAGKRLTYRRLVSAT